MSDNDQFNGFESPAVNVLLVDDNKVNQFLGKKILRNLGILNVDVAGDGATALQMLKEKNFNVLLTDVEMPGMNGYELTAAVRKSNLHDITIIALTANASESERRYALENGMNDYISKPYSPADLLTVLRKHVLTRDSFVLSDHLHAPVSSNDPVKSLYALFNGNKDDVKNLLLLLRQQLPEGLSMIRQSILEENREALFHSAHKLKSTIKLFNDPELFQLVSDLTEYSRTDSMYHLVPSLYDEFHMRLDSILVLVNKELESI